MIFNLCSVIGFINHCIINFRGVDINQGKLMIKMCHSVSGYSLREIGHTVFILPRINDSVLVPKLLQSKTNTYLSMSETLLLVDFFLSPIYHGSMGCFDFSTITILVRNSNSLIPHLVTSSSDISEILSVSLYPHPI